MSKNLIILFILFFIAFKIKAYDFERCITDPNADRLQFQWKEYQSLLQKKIRINSSILVKELKMDEETMKLLQAVSESEKLIYLLDQLQVNYLKKAFIDLRFNEMISSPDFIDRVRSKKIDLEIKGSELKFKDDLNFYQLLDEIRSELNRKEILDALEFFRKYDLGILENSYRKSAKMALHLIRKKGATLTEVRKWISDPPFIRNVPLPSEKLGPFAVRYRTLLKKSIISFVKSRDVLLNDAKKLYPRIKQADIDRLNQISPPVEANSYDENIYNTNDKLNSAIDGVLRTLWGEAASCEDLGLAQFEAIGKIIADRSIAVCRAIEEESKLSKVNMEVREKNWMTVLQNWVGINRPAPGMQNKATNKYKGLADFGRKEKTDMHCGAQVISKKNQFSVWNSYSLIKVHSGQFHQNIPNVDFEIQGPQNQNDDKALIRILCPTFINNKQKELWQKALGIAKEIVQDPISFSLKYQWPKKLEIYFYTHDANLNFAKEVKVNGLLKDNLLLKLSSKEGGTCNKFRLFIPKQSGQY